MHSNGDYMVISVAHFPYVQDHDLGGKIERLYVGDSGDRFCCLERTDGDVRPVGGESTDLRVADAAEHPP